MFQVCDGFQVCACQVRNSHWTFFCSIRQNNFKLTWRSHTPTQTEIKINIETWLILGIGSCERLTRVKIWYWNVNICCNLGIDMLKFFSTFVSAIQRCMSKGKAYLGHGLDNFLPYWGLHANLLPGWRKEERGLMTESL